MGNNFHWAELGAVRLDQLLHCAAAPYASFSCVCALKVDSNMKSKGAFYFTKIQNIAHRVVLLHT